MRIEKIELSDFTLFEELQMEFTPGINILLGANGTGKTHLMKLLYAACSAGGKKNEVSHPFWLKLQRVFFTIDSPISHLVKRGVGKHKPILSETHIRIWLDGKKLQASFSNTRKHMKTAGISSDWPPEVPAVYIPTKEMLASAPGFIALYEKRAIAFEEVYRDILLEASLDAPRERLSGMRKKLVAILSEIIDGKVDMEETGEFYFKDGNGRLEFSLLSEGMRKLALLLLLIDKNILTDGSILFWDEPEANLNPSMMKTIATVILELQRMGMQIFLATHDFALANFLDLLRGENDKMAFHSFARCPESNGVLHSSSADFSGVDPNVINDTFVQLAELDFNRALKRVGK